MELTPEDFLRDDESEVDSTTEDSPIKKPKIIRPTKPKAKQVRGTIVRFEDEACEVHCLLPSLTYITLTLIKLTVWLRPQIP